MIESMIKVEPFFYADTLSHYFSPSLQQDMDIVLKNIGNILSTYQLKCNEQPTATEWNKALP